MIPPTWSIVQPPNPFLAHVARSRDMPVSTPPAPPIIPPPAFPMHPPLLQCKSQKCPFQGFSELVCGHMGAKWIRSFKRHAR